MMKIRRSLLGGLVILASLAFSGCQTESQKRRTEEKHNLDKSYLAALVKYGDANNDGLVSIQEEDSLIRRVVEKTYGGKILQGKGSGLNNSYNAFGKGGSPLRDKQVREAVADYSGE